MQSKVCNSGHYVYICTNINNMGNKTKRSPGDGDNGDKKIELSEKFALRIVRLERFLRNKKSERRISDQIFRSGTSIGANLAEANYAESKSDFIHKLSVAQKEANETLYWLRLLHNGNFLDDIQFNSLYKDCSELLRVITKIICTSKTGNRTKSE